MKTQTEIKKSKFVSQAELKRQGWELFTERGCYQVYRHSVHSKELYYCKSSKLILGIYLLS